MNIVTERWKERLLFIVFANNFNYKIMPGSITVVTVINFCVT